MPIKQFGISLLEFVLTVALAALVVFVTYRALIRTNTDFDEDEELRKGNLAVGALVFALLIAAANMIEKAFAPAVESLHFTLMGMGGAGLPWWKSLLAMAGNLAVGFFLTVLVLSRSLRFFGKFTRNVQEGKELFKGNFAVGIVLSAVVLIVSMMVGDGIGSISKSLTPKASVSRIRVMR